MAIPWMQIVKWMPSIVQVSRELMRRTERQEVTDLAHPTSNDLAERVIALEDNERRQAQLVNQMAEQLAQMSQVLIMMRRRELWLSVGLAVAVGIAIAAIVLATR
jgi:primosomal protein N''